MPSNMDDKSGVDNLDAALSGDLNLHGSNKEQIAAMGGEFDEDLDGFASSPADRGDLLESDEAPADRGDEVKDEEKPEEETDEEEVKDEEDSEETGDEEDSETAEDAEEGDDEADAESTDEESETEDTTDGDTESDEKPGKVKVPPGYLPKTRFDEVNARRKAAEDELAALKAEREAGEKSEKSEYDFVTAEKAYADLILEGKTEEAGAKRAEIRAAERAEFAAEMRETTTSTVTQQQVSADLNEIVADYETKYDAFNPESESFSEDLVDEVQAFYVGYLNQRTDLTPQQAFHLAVNNTVKIYGLEEGEGTTEEAEAEAETTTKKTRKAVKKDTKKKLELAKKAPADTSKAGAAGDSSGETEMDINQMTDDELDALPQSTLARLRGDIL